MWGVLAVAGCGSSLQPSGSGGGGSGGSPATGGVPGTGGVPSTGGVPGAGGATHVSCGATVCTATEFCCDPLCSVCAPTGSLCTQGCALDGGSPGVGVCASLEARYDQALASARACTPATSGACSATLPAALRGSECGCNPVPVNDGAQADAIYQSWLSLGCNRILLCIDCRPPVRAGVCVVGDGGTGTCQFATDGGG